MQHGDRRNKRTSSSNCDTFTSKFLFWCFTVINQTTPQRVDHYILHERVINTVKFRRNDYKKYLCFQAFMFCTFWFVSTKAEELKSSSVNVNQRVTEQRPGNEANNTRHNITSLTLHSRSHFLPPCFARSFRLLSSHRFLLRFAVLGRAERAHVSTGAGSVALHPAFLATKTKLLVLSQRQTQSVSKIDCLTSQTVTQTATWDTMIIYDSWFILLKCHT